MFKECIYCGKTIAEVEPVSDHRVLHSSHRKCRKKIVHQLKKKQHFLGITWLWKKGD